MTDNDRTPAQVAYDEQCLFRNAALAQAKREAAKAAQQQASDAAAFANYWKMV